MQHPQHPLQDLRVFFFLVCFLPIYSAKLKLALAQLAQLRPSHYYGKGGVFLLPISISHVYLIWMFFDLSSYSFCLFFSNKLFNTRLEFHARKTCTFFFVHAEVFYRKRV